MQKLNFVNKTAESKYFGDFPLVFSRKSIIIVVWININGRHANRSRKRKTSITECSQRRVLPVYCGVWKTSVGKTFLIRVSIAERQAVPVQSRFCLVISQYPFFLLPIHFSTPIRFRYATSRLTVASDNPVFAHKLSLGRVLSSRKFCNIMLCLSVCFIGSFPK